MSEKNTFTNNATAKIIKTVQKVLGEGIDATGSPSHKRSYYSTGFWARLTDHVGTEFDGIQSPPYFYAWSELNESGTDHTQAVKSGGRSGTTSTDYAQNVWENAANMTGPLPNGTEVWIEYSFEIDGTAHWRFNQQQPTNCLVKVTGVADYTGGVYDGNIWITPTPSADIDPTADFTEAVIGSSGPQAIIFNTRELGKTTHDLSSSGYLPLIFLGQVFWTNSDGKYCVAIDGIQSADCDSDGDLESGE